MIMFKRYLDRLNELRVITESLKKEKQNIWIRYDDYDVDIDLDNGTITGDDIYISYDDELEYLYEFYKDKLTKEELRERVYANFIYNLLKKDIALVGQNELGVEYEFPFSDEGYKELRTQLAKDKWGDDETWDDEYYKHDDY